jgi:hypothetical protein
MAHCKPTKIVTNKFLCPPNIFQNNRLVKFTIIFEALFSILPAFTSILFNLVTGEPSANYIGQYGIALSYVDIACCTIFYSWVVMKNGKSVGKVSSFVVTM